MVEKNKQKADYGQDVPEMLVEDFVAGGILTIIGVCMHRWGRSPARESTTSQLIAWLGLAAVVTGALTALEGVTLIWGSRVVKLQLRDKLLDALHLRGNETVLDLGCGHGLLLIGAAKRLPQGKAFGVDLWSQKDQGDNSKAATLANARIEGVLDRVEVYDSDMRQLPFANSSIDAVVASIAIHNVENSDGRRQTMREIARVLKPGGKVAIMDIFCIDEYRDGLKAEGLHDVRVSAPNFAFYPPMRSVTAIK